MHCIGCTGSGFPPAMVVAWLAALVLPSLCSAFPPDPLFPPALVQHIHAQPGLLRGFVDPTAPPYGAAGDGRTDDAEILQRAVDDAYHARISVVLPAGRTFLLSRQLSFHQHNRSRAAGFQIFGGAGARRPVLKLQDNAAKDAFPLREGHEDVYGSIFLLFQLNNPKSPIAGQESEHYNSRFRGIDIDLGENPNVSGLSMAGAQQCSIEDVHITGKAFRAGLVGLPGSGGFSANIAVTGGEYGIMQDSYRPNPSISGLSLSGQRKAGLRIDLSHGPTVISGFSIESEAEPLPTYRAVLLVNGTLVPRDNSGNRLQLGGSTRNGAQGQNSAFNGEDGRILLHGALENSTAIESRDGSDVVLKNVYIHGARTLIFGRPATWTWGNRLDGVVVAAVGTAADWTFLSSFAFTLSNGSIFDHGRLQSKPSYTGEPLRAVAQSPAASVFLTQHSWSFDTLPTWESERLLDVSAAYGATPQWVNATDDDGARIQKAIEDACDPASAKYGSVVFVPHGLYGLYRPIDLLGCASIIGAGSHSTALAPVNPGKGEWKARDGVSNRPVLVSTSSLYYKQRKQHQREQADEERMMVIQDFDLYTQASSSPFIDISAGENILLRDIGISLFCSASGKSGQWPPPLPDQQDRSGLTRGDTSEGSAMEAAEVDANESAAAAEVAREEGPPPAFVTIRAVSGASKLFGLPLDGIFGNADGMSLLLVSAATAGRVDFYQASTEHSPHNPQTLIIDSSNVHFHSWKYESSLTGDKSKTSNSSLVWIRNSTNISTFGGSGYYRTYLGAPMIVLEGQTSGIALAGMEREWAYNEPKTGTEWLSDEARGVSLDGHLALLYYNDRH